MSDQKGVSGQTGVTLQTGMSLQTGVSVQTGVSGQTAVLSFQDIETLLLVLTVVCGGWWVGGVFGL